MFISFTGMPAWLFFTLATPAVGAMVYFMVLFIKDKFGSK